MNARTHDMKLAIGLALVIGLPMVARAQQIQVPAIAQANASAAVNVTTLHASDGSGGTAPGTAPSTTPTAGPPPINLLSPSAPLNAKERQAVTLSQRWQNRAELPQRGEDGVVRFLYGATLPTVVCAPLQV